MACILVMDDDAVTRRLLRDILEKLLKQTVREARTVEEAVAEARQGTFDLMFLDNHLPDGTVADFCRLLKESGVHQETPKWIISGEKPLADPSRPWDGPRVQGFLVKPFRLDHILQIVEPLLR